MLEPLKDIQLGDLIGLLLEELFSQDRVTEVASFEEVLLRLLNQSSSESETWPKGLDIQRKVPAEARNTSDGEGSDKKIRPESVPPQIGPLPLVVDTTPDRKTPPLKGQGDYEHTLPRPNPEFFTSEQVSGGDPPMKGSIPGDKERRWIPVPQRVPGEPVEGEARPRDLQTPDQGVRVIGLEARDPREKVYRSEVEGPKIPYRTETDRTAPANGVKAHKPVSHEVETETRLAVKVGDNIRDTPYTPEPRPVMAPERDDYVETKREVPIREKPEDRDTPTVAINRDLKPGVEREVRVNQPPQDRTNPLKPGRVEPEAQQVSVQEFFKPQLTEEVREKETTAEVRHQPVPKEAGKEVRRISVRIEEAVLRFKFQGSNLTVEVRSPQEIHNQITFMESYRLMRALQNIGVNLESLRVNGVEVVPKTLRSFRRDERDRFNIEENEDLTKEVSYSPADSSDLSLLL